MLHAEELGEAIFNNEDSRFHGSSPLCRRFECPGIRMQASCLWVNCLKY
jgi:hypothetical protein